MKEEINKIIKESNLKVGLYASNLQDTIEINANHIFESASCIMVFVLIEFYKQVDENKINEKEIFIFDKDNDILGLNFEIISLFDYGLKLTAKDYATLMIVFSDSIATNKLIDFLGIDNINNTIKSLGLKNTFLCNKLDLLKYFKFGTTTPYEYAKVYEMLLRGEVINKQVSKKVLNILKKQRNFDMLKKGLPPIDILFKGTNDSNINYIASKNGSIVWVGNEMKNARNDGGIISTKDRDIIISIFITDIDDLQLNYDNKGIECGGKIVKLIYDEFIKQGENDND